MHHNQRDDLKSTHVRHELTRLKMKKEKLRKKEHA
jgi:hypothetical protein